MMSRHPPADFVHVFELTRGGHFMLLTLGPRPAAVAGPFELRMLHLTEQPAGPGDVTDTQGHLAGAYGMRER
ncbi:hypothetical protein [Pendulispora albinea]|uniref:Uncharacterized protein n=1 Tax=Pendulispora albinea TaxID=2741071 RepID=A0ABZ2LWP8_9BACT